MVLVELVVGRACGGRIISYPRGSIRVKEDNDPDEVDEIE